MFIDIQHGLLDALFVKVDQAFSADCFADTFAGFCGIYADDIELTAGVLVNKIMVDFGPAKSSDLFVMNAEKEAIFIEPRFSHTVFEICHCPIALVGVFGKDEVIKV